jgi:hypothetical protein
MAIPFFAFWVLLIWSLIDGDLYPKEGAIFVAVWAALLAGFLLLKIPMLWFVVPMVLLDIVLMVKVFGQNIEI